MELLLEFIKILLPALAVLYAMYITVKSFLDKQLEHKVLDIKAKHKETTLPLRLQAYERMCLFLERITPNNLLVRLNDSNYTAKEFQQIMIADIREEFNHNLSQQLYMSDKAWEMVTAAKEDVLSTIHMASKELNENAKSVDLAKKIFDLMLQKENDQVQTALKVVKDEIRVLL